MGSEGFPSGCQPPIKRTVEKTGIQTNNLPYRSLADEVERFFIVLTHVSIPLLGQEWQCSFKRTLKCYSRNILRNELFGMFSA
jgi:hypothetical protein